MAAALNANDIEHLVASVDGNVRTDGCDHTLRFTEQWAANNGVEWHHLADVLEEQCLSD